MSENFLMVVTFRDLTLTPTRACYDTCAHMVSSLPSPLRLFWLSFEQKLLILPSLGVIIQKRQNLTFDLTLTRELRSILKS